MPAICQLDFKTSESASYFARDKNIRKRSVLVGGPSKTAAGNQTVVNRNPEELPLSLLFSFFRGEPAYICYVVFKEVVCDVFKIIVVEKA